MSHGSSGLVWVQKNIDGVALAPLIFFFILLLKVVNPGLVTCDYPDLESSSAPEAIRQQPSPGPLWSLAFFADLSS